MSKAHAIGFACLALQVAASLAFVNEPVSAQGQPNDADPMEITTDTPEYCAHLLKRVSELLHLARAPVPKEVGDLTSEGQRMCDHGQTRSGILRLRSALMLMEKPNGPAYQ